MKINIVFLFLSLLLAILVGYAAHTFSNNDFKWFYVISGSAVLFIYLFSATAVGNLETRKTINLRAVSFIFILMQIFVMFFYASAGHMIQGFIICSVFVMIAFFLIVFSIFGNKKNNI